MKIIDNYIKTILNESQEYEVPLLKDKHKRKFKTNIPPEKRTLKNLPRYSNRKPKVQFSKWLCLKNTSKSKYSIGQAADGSWYGWSHRAIASFKIGSKITKNTIGNNSGKEYKIKTDNEAMNFAIKFAKSVS